MIIILILAVLGLLLSLTAHLSTFLPGMTPQSAWLLQYALPLVWLPIFFTDGKYLFTRQEAWGPGEVEPKWVRRARFVTIAYAILNWIVSMVILNRGGIPVEVDGGYALKTFGQGVVIRALTEAEYAWHRVVLIRAASGYWAYLYLFGASILLTRLLRFREAASQPAPQEEMASP